MCSLIMFVSLTTGATQVLNTLENHPRPDWARPWVDLNGAWRFEFDPQDEGISGRWNENHSYGKTIQTPYPWQSELSGVYDKHYQGAAWYERDIEIPHNLPGERIFLVFGAIDWSARVWVDGKETDEHEGGYTPFEVELTERVKRGQTARITVRAFDSTDPETPNGKQTGWYTPTGGIWQSVYLEGRGKTYIKYAHVFPDIDAKTATIRGELAVMGEGRVAVLAHATHAQQRISAKAGVIGSGDSAPFEVVVPIKEPALWSPESPNLYTLLLELTVGDTVADTVSTYFGMRKISRGKFNGSDNEYILLNDKPIYIRGALHQSFTPKGIYTHPDDDFIRRDYEKTKEFGLNFLRIHIKVDEPRALYWADKLGVMLMCDMPSFNKKTDRAKTLWEQTLRSAITRDFNHPSVISWCCFNETWGIDNGGYDRQTQEWVRDMYLLTKRLDPTRLVEDNSPCNYDHTVSDINSWHFYIDDYERARDHIAQVVEKTHPGSQFNYAQGWLQETAPLINSEYGGVSAGSGDADISWVFLFLTNLLRKYDKIGGYVYTELEDIEWEHNGFMNYDRSEKFYNYPAGITVAQLQNEEFLVFDCPPYQEVVPGTTADVPLMLSHWSERDGLTIRVFAAGETVDGKPWDTLIQAEERAVSGEPFSVVSLDPYRFTAPNAAGLVSIVGEILYEGKRLAANYCVLQIRGDVWTAPNVAGVWFPVSGYSKIQFEQDSPTSFEGPGKVYGYGAGFVEYKLKLPKDLASDDVEKCALHVELASKANKERLAWPERENRNDYPQSDGVLWPTDISISLNGVEVGGAHIASDFADARGVLSHVADWHHGSCGEVVRLEFGEAALGEVRNALAKKRPVTIRFEVKSDAAARGGLSVFGRDMGAWPSDPTFVFTLKDGVAKPKGEITVLDVHEPQKK